MKLEKNWSIRIKSLLFGGCASLFYLCRSWIKRCEKVFRFFLFLFLFCKRKSCLCRLCHQLMIYYFSNSICCILHSFKHIFNLHSRRLSDGRAGKWERAWRGIDDRLNLVKIPGGLWLERFKAREVVEVKGRSGSLVMCFKRLFGAGWLLAVWWVEKRCETRYTN